MGTSRAGWRGSILPRSQREERPMRTRASIVLLILAAAALLRSVPANAAAYLRGVPYFNQFANALEPNVTASFPPLADAIPVVSPVTKS